MRVIIQNNYEDLCNWAASYIAKRINEYQATPSHQFVLGLPTGESPLGVYRVYNNIYQRLIELYKQGSVSFQNVVTFNMDEYCGIPKSHEQSYYTFMWNNFFSHIDIKPENTNFLDGNARDLEEECRRVY